MSKRNFVVTSILAAAFAMSAFAQSASTTITRTFSFPPVGLGSTETAQVNVLNRASASSSGTAASCTGSIQFANSSGTVIGKSTTFTIGTGQISSVPLPFGTSGFSGTRGVFVASVTTTVPSAAPCELAVALETFATATGETHVVLTGEGGGPGYGGGPGR